MKHVSSPRWLHRCSSRGWLGCWRRSAPHFVAAGAFAFLAPLALAANPVPLGGVTFWSAADAPSIHVEVIEPVSLETLAQGVPFAYVVNTGSVALPLEAALSRSHGGPAPSVALDGNALPRQLGPGRAAWLTATGTGLDALIEQAATFRAERWTLVLHLGHELDVRSFAVDAVVKTIPFLADRSTFEFDWRPFWPDAMRHVLRIRPPSWVIPVTPRTLSGRVIEPCAPPPLVEAPVPSGVWTWVWLAEGQSGSANWPEDVLEGGCELYAGTTPIDAKGRAGAVVFDPLLAQGTYTSRLAYVNAMSEGELVPVEVTFTRHAPALLALVILLLGIVAATVLENFATTFPKAREIQKRLKALDAEPSSRPSGAHAKFIESPVYSSLAGDITRMRRRATLGFVRPVTTNANLLVESETELSKLESLVPTWNALQVNWQTLRKRYEEVNEKVSQNGAQPFVPPNHHARVPAWLHAVKDLSCEDPLSIRTPEDLVAHHNEVVKSLALVEAWLAFHTGFGSTRDLVEQLYAAGINAAPPEREAAIELRMTWEEVWHELWRAGSGSEFAQLMTAADFANVIRGVDRLRYLVRQAGTASDAGSSEGMDHLRSVLSQLPGLADVGRLAQLVFDRVEAWVYRWGTWLTFFTVALIGAAVGLVDIYYGNVFFGPFDTLLYAFLWGFGGKVTIDAVGELLAGAGSTLRSRASAAKP